MYCGNCGAQMDDGTSACPSCGRPVKKIRRTVPQRPTARPSQRQMPEITRPKGSSGKMLPMILGVLVVVLVLGFVGSKLFGTKKNSSVAKLAEYVKRTQEIVDKAYQEYDTWKDDPENEQTAENKDGAFDKRADVIKTLITDVTEMQEKADELKQLPENAKDAKDAYYKMLIDSNTSLLGVLDFFSNYLTFYWDYISEKPVQGEEDIKSYYYKLEEWYENTMAACEEIQCPASVESVWTQYKTALELNENVLHKIAVAANNNDLMSYYSSWFMNERYDVVEANVYDKILDVSGDEFDFAVTLKTKSNKIADEIFEYNEMGAKEQENHEFTSIPDKKMSLQYQAIDTIYPALYNTYDAFLIVKVGAYYGDGTITVEMEIPGFTQKIKQNYYIDSSYQYIYLKPPALTGELDLSAAKDAQISLSIYKKDGSLIDSQSFPVHIKSINDVEWYSDEFGNSTQDNILTFLTPESTKVTELKRLAIDILTQMTDGRMDGLVGYQNNYTGNVEIGTFLQASSLMLALQQWGVRYNMDGFSVDGSNQHILMPSQVLEQKTGLCIETSLVMASALQSADFHVYLYFPPGHAKVAVETANGSGMYYAIETTALTQDANYYIEYVNALMNGKLPEKSGSPIQLFTAEEMQKLVLEQGGYLIDCNDSRILGLTPFAH